MTRRVSLVCLTLSHLFAGEKISKPARALIESVFWRAR